MAVAGVTAVWNAIKTVGGWAFKNSGAMIGIAERVTALRSSKDKEEYIATMDEKIDQVGGAVLELDEKIALVREELDATRKEVQLLKKILLGMGIALGVAIIAVVVSFLI